MNFFRFINIPPEVTLLMKLRLNLENSNSGNNSKGDIDEGNEVENHW